MAQTTVLETQLELGNGDVWEAIVGVNRGKLTVTVTKTQGILNFTMYQSNSSLMIYPLDTLENNFTEEVTSEEGEIFIRVTSERNFIASQVTIRIIQENSNFDGILIGGFVLFALLMPFVYLIGKTRGQKLT